ncbi:hypothetical protein FOZ60_002395 [Perkinsus olseni]|uniref:Uncharacterized protein n=1 Tax=Perkinsus olseni TaxID=32597 RepID=A0A7J6NY84_PEROL|nr:hypothetical protein FOZ60_002395 [Perkinsus olseni]KAF4711233.1 hypothetical protein FOZ62_016838 [Perkinsus olseni]
MATMMLMSAPSPFRIINSILVSAAVLRHSVLAGPGVVYGKGIISSAFVEFNSEVIRRGSEAIFEITTGDDAEIPDVTCESPWMRLRAFNGGMDGTGKQIRLIEYKFIPRPGDNDSFEKFTLCLAEATGLPRSFEAELTEDDIRIRVGIAIRSRFEASYKDGGIATCSVEFKDEAIEEGSEARFTLTTSDEAVKPFGSCQSPWMRVKTVQGKTGDVRLGTGTLIYKFIARPGDSTEFEAYTRCIVDATGLPAMFTAELIDGANPRVNMKVGKLPNKGKRLVTGLALEVRLSIENLVDKRKPLVEAEGVDGNEASHGQPTDEVDGRRSYERGHGQSTEEVDGRRSNEGGHGQQTDEVDGRRLNEGGHGQPTDEVDGRTLNDEGHGQLTGIGGRKMRKYVPVRPTEAPSLKGKSSGKTKNGGRPSDCDRHRKHKKRSGCIIL